MNDLSRRLAALSPAQRALLSERLAAAGGRGASGRAIPVREGGGDAPTSFAQQRLWFLDQLEPGNPAYNISTAMRLRGRLDAAALERCFGEIVRRHESLRTTFPAAGGLPLQRVAPPEPFVLPLEDLGGCADPVSEARRRAGQEAAAPFDLSAGPLMRARLLRLSAEEHVLLLTLHHIVADGWSLGVLTSEVSALYEAYGRGAASPLAELPIQYGDFARWQREHLRGEELERQLAFWRERLADAPPLSLPKDKPPPPAQTFNGATQTLELNGRLADGLRALGRAEGATLFMTLLAGWQALLSRYAGQRDVSVGTPVAGRTRVETEGLIGNFGNTLVLRTCLAGDPSFRELLRRVRQVALDAYAHQDVPFEKLVEELQPERDMSQSALFQVMFTLQNTPAPGRMGGGLTLESLTPETDAVKFQLDLNVWETAGGLFCALGYNTDLFEPDTPRRMLDHFHNLLEEAVARPEAPLSALELMSPGERHRLLVEWNDTKRLVPRLSLHELFERQAAAAPGRAAVVSDGETLTYGELNRRANRLARHLRRLGVGREVLVGVCVERTPEMVVSLLAVLKAGAAYVPLDPTFPAQRLAIILEDAGAQVLLTERSLAGSLPPHAALTVCLDERREALAGESEADLDLEVRGDDLAYVIFTSGSTGRPKGVMVSHGSVVNLLHSMLDRPGLSEQDTLLSVTTLSFDIAALEIFLPLISGARLALVGREAAADGARLLAAIEGLGATVMQATPATWRLLLASGWGEGRRLKLLCGGEAMPADLARELLSRSSSLWNLYGPTETTIWSALSRVETVCGAPPLGGPVFNTQLYVLDADLNPVPVGVRGELCIAGAGLARGYLGRPSLTADRFLPDHFSPVPGARLYRTGDLARWLADGQLEFLGRDDQQVKVRGFRIEPGEVEAALCRHPAVAAAVVVARDVSPGDRRLVAYVVPPPGEAARVRGEELRRHARESLPDYMVPSSFVTLDELPLTPNGKLDRRRLPDPQSARGEDQLTAPPRTPVEEVLAGIWQEVLGVGRVGADDDFFELGGHSLLATQVVSRLRDAFGLALPLRTIFDSPTLSSLAAAVDRLGSSDLPQPPPLRRAARTGPLPLSFAQQRLWFIDQLEPGSAAYNMPAAVRLRGPLDARALERALGEIVRRHESLRTTFADVGGLPVQVVAETLELKLGCTDLSALDGEAREAEALRLAGEEARRPFDLSAGPLLRASLLRLGEDEHVALVTMHHVISDGWSVGVFVREMGALYESFARGEESPLAELPVQYADYAIWQREWLTGEVLERQLAYWRTRLDGAPPLKLGGGRARASGGGATRRLTLGRELTEGLMALGRREGATLFMTLLAGWQALLSRYTGQEDISVGTDVANRHRGETEGLIGFFVNQLVMRTDLSGNPSFRELLGRVRETALGAYAHQDLPFEKLVEELNPERDDAHATPLFQTKLVLQNAPLPSLALPGLLLTPLESGGDADDAAAAKFDLLLDAAESDAGLNLSLTYRTDLFDGPFIARLLGHFQTLLGFLVERPDASLRAADIRTAGEKDRQAGEQTKLEGKKMMKFKTVKPSVVSLSPEALVRTGHLGHGPALPLVVEPAADGVELAEWAAGKRDWIEESLHRYGGLLFRGFGAGTQADFERFLDATCSELMEYMEGATPRTRLNSKVYTSTEYPPDQSIALHNELTYVLTWPMKIWFFCVQPAARQGETPIADVRRVYERIPAAVRGRFEEQGWMLVRNFGEGLSLPWQTSFHADSRAEVEAYFRRARIDYEWKDGGRLRTRQVRPATARHPRTGETVWFNHVAFWHASSLEPAVREAMLSMFGEAGLPYNTYYGDGSPIEDSVVEELRAAYRAETVEFGWQKGDLLMLDNMLVAHGRNPFGGARKIVVSMGEPYARADF